ncbi:hypothetical protein C2125_13800 [Rahnella aquatilis]|jgi:hypothetical protein|nr:hypothetical protein [Rahnella aquatilis]RBQ33728.1 hypothetical protein C2125_13800 [Rahnella aquatilis]
MRAVKALYRPPFVIFVLLLVTQLGGWAKLMHIGVMPAEWIMWRVIAMLTCFFIIVAWALAYDESREALYLEIAFFIAPWVLYLIGFVLCSIALWRPYTDMVTAGFFYAAGGISYGLILMGMIAVRLDE